MIARIGELAAFGTAVSWTVGAIMMEKSVCRVGVMAVNTLKVAFAAVYLALFSFILHGSFFPTDLPPHAIVFLCASGFVGFVITDYFLFHAYALIGSRIALLLSSLSVPLTVLGSWAFWGAIPGPRAFIGMAVCAAGIVVTVSFRGTERKKKRDDSATGGAAAAQAQNDCVARVGAVSALTETMRYRKGVAYSLIASVGTAAATLLTKSGAAGIDSVSATQLRIMSALVGFILFAVVTRKTKEITAVAFHPKNGLGLIALGGVFGPFLGVGMLLYAIQHADAGVVSTLSSLTPVLIILPAIFLQKRKVAPAEIVGACVAMCGLALIFA